MQDNLQFTDRRVRYEPGTGVRLSHSYRLYLRADLVCLRTYLGTVCTARSRHNAVDGWRGTFHQTDTDTEIFPTRKDAAEAVLALYEAWAVVEEERRAKAGARIAESRREQDAAEAAGQAWVTAALTATPDLRDALLALVTRIDTFDIDAGWLTEQMDAARAALALAPKGTNPYLAAKSDATPGGAKEVQA